MDLEQDKSGGLKSDNNEFTQDQLTETGEATQDQLSESGEASQDQLTESGEVQDFEIIQEASDIGDEQQMTRKSAAAEAKPAARSSLKGFLFDLLFYALLIFVCIYIIPNYVMQRTIVDGSSMEDTLSDGDQLYVEKLSYRFDMLKRFDIVVFYPYGRENKEYYVKRIIGMPGETIQIKDSVIYIDGKPLEEHYGLEPIEDPGRAAEPITLDKDEYFVMGDNRNISKDSRYPTVGNVKKENIGGRAFLRISPLKKFGFID